MDIVINIPVSHLTAPASALAAHYRFLGLSRQRAWDEFIKDRNLRPEMDAKEFYSLFIEAYPCELVEHKVIQFAPTHWDKLMECYVSINQRPDGVYDMNWATGMTGGNPPSIPPDPDRYIPLEKWHGPENEGQTPNFN